ncbi:NmrA family NAD(P)-binding protein [Paenibacillus sp. NAIST15-1]|uniref:NmrA family NAD(P)-binding protein n=1 Tax=Paenibacillus sp. NAIST15-1 TaxID=1605994 RepID=UPI00086C7701|nr:NmrA family NAD(P)-binding protein [Paenibacillus sp. NAIST15-1]GAV13107.1 hypothetical protein PBN151_3040 [Paenibacillus sp. NAIST15-1]
MIVVIGATGTIGRELLNSLIQANVPVRAISREPDKLRIQLGAGDHRQVEIVQADASDASALRSAFQGASQLFMSMSNSPRQVELESTIIRTAIEAGIEHIVKISSPLYNALAPVEIARWHLEIETLLNDSGILHTVLRPYAFMQNLLRLTGPIRKHNAFYGSMGSSACNYIDCRDIADVAAEVLTNHKKAGRIYTLTGSEVFNYEQIAAKFTAMLGRPITYINMDSNTQRRSLMEQDHMPLWLANHVVEIQAMSAVIPEHPTDTVARLLGQAPRTLDNFLEEHIGLFQ